jgi:hypothetical protein
LRPHLRSEEIDLWTQSSILPGQNPIEKHLHPGARLDFSGIPR